MSQVAEKVASMKLYLETPADVMGRLDDERRAAEQDCCDDAAIWFDLARRYDAQGRPAQAGSCRRRGEHYGFPVGGQSWTGGIDFSGDGQHYTVVTLVPVSVETAA